MIGQYEIGQRNPKVDTLSEIATALNVQISELMGLNPVVDTPENRAIMNETTKMLVRAGVILKSDTIKERIDAALDQLNADGQQKAVERVEELTEIPKYQRQPPQDTPTVHSEGKDTTPPESPSEEPQEGK